MEYSGCANGIFRYGRRRAAEACEFQFEREGKVDISPKLEMPKTKGLANVPDVVSVAEKKPILRSLDMGRVKLELKRIEKNTNRQITFSKQQTDSTCHCIASSLLHLSVCSHRFLYTTWIEDVLARYINLPDQERENAIVFPDQSKRQAIQNKEYLLRTLEKLKIEDDMALQINEPRPEAINTDVEELEQEVCRLQQQLQISEEELRKFEPDPMRFTSMEEIEACETHLINTLTSVVQRREHLLRKSCEAPSNQQSMQGILLNDIVEDWGSEAEPKQAHVMANSAHQSNQLSYDLLLQGSNSSSNQNPK
ncbi:agamous-like MADS-box protein AGL66 [Arabidopsis lyrata subsp. lyrata]|uniref:agamous-like MADS-box protein AGL66 n=1 Tax=Arabidopsis lyrata subsp. lyrata TaxID=81972 RepID=UPI000A29C764|nr:agamous-like MADS-box protein AGL66 [Arabidopsis lyrata subsp. lyrata]|eukprot:XP_020865771.1 agamous-like MADS-box protein AGL66 [Arabidopsis lyrata subsp. lyrata]